jgi:hypothetical protein
MHDMLSDGFDPRANRLLAALPHETWNRWKPHLRLAELSCRQELTHAGTGPAHAIFPTTSIVSLMCMTQDGATAEVCVVGNDGVVGIPQLQGGTGAPGQPVVQSAGLAYRLEARLVTEEILRGGEVLSMLLAYARAVLAQAVQTALCNRHHSIEQQVCRRLLQGLDRSPSGELAMTQSGIAFGLGVRREGVTEAALKLQQAGVIRYRRGRIVVLDRQRLEQQSCECYRAARIEHDSLLPVRGRPRPRPGSGGTTDRIMRTPALAPLTAAP